MAAPEFCFTLECQAPALSLRMVRDLVTQVLGSIGCAGEVERAVEGIEAAMNGRASHDTLALLFRANAGTLDITLSAGSHPVWQTSCPVPEGA